MPAQDGQCVVVAVAHPIIDRDHEGPCRHRLAGLEPCVNSVLCRPQRVGVQYEIGGALAGVRCMFSVDQPILNAFVFRFDGEDKARLWWNYEVAEFGQTAPAGWRVHRGPQRSHHRRAGLAQRGARVLAGPGGREQQAALVARLARGQHRHGSSSCPASRSRRARRPRARRSWPTSKRSGDRCPPRSARRLGRWNRSIPLPPDGHGWTSASSRPIRCATAAASPRRSSDELREDVRDVVVRRPRD